MTYDGAARLAERAERDMKHAEHAFAHAESEAARRRHRRNMDQAAKRLGALAYEMRQLQPAA